MASITRRSVVAEQSSPNSTRALATSRTYLAPEAATRAGVVTGTISTRPRAGAAALTLRWGLARVVPRRARFTCHARSERPSIPRSRAHSPRLRSPRSAAIKQRRASVSSLIFRPVATRHLRDAEEAAWNARARHPGVADGSRRYRPRWVPVPPKSPMPARPPVVVRTDRPIRRGRVRRVRRVGGTAAGSQVRSLTVSRRGTIWAAEPCDLHSRECLMEKAARCDL